jgi:LysM repeat protein
MRIKLFTIIALFIGTICHAQQTAALPYSAWLLEAKDSVFIELDGAQSHLIHKVKAGHTIYGIKRFYGMEASDLFYANPNLEGTSLKLGQKIRIPLVGKAIKRTRPTYKEDTAYAKVYYKVRSKETLWRIARVHFKMPVEVLQKRNHLSSTAVTKGQVLQIGWIHRGGIADSLRRFTGLTGVLAEANTKLRKKYDATLLKGKEEVLQEGKACWPKHQDLGQDNTLYVLHSESPVGSVVRIENPMTERILYAKVLGPVPNTPFARGAIVMLSPTVAQALGALDAKIYVKLQYLK